MSRYIINEPDIIRSKKLNEFTFEFSFVGKPDAGQVLWRGSALRAMRLKSITGDSDVAATASAAFSFLDDGVSVGSATWGVGSTTAIGAVTPNTIIAAGSVLKLLAPAVQDSTLTNGTILIAFDEG